MDSNRRGFTLELVLKLCIQGGDIQRLRYTDKRFQVVAHNIRKLT